jgi:hypothetical protein
MHIVLYTQAISSLLYLTTYIRPNLAYVINHLVRFMTNPSPIHWLGLKQFFCYLQSTHMMRILYDGKPNNLTIMQG